MYLTLTLEMTDNYFPWRVPCLQDEWSRVQSHGNRSNMFSSTNCSAGLFAFSLTSTFCLIALCLWGSFSQNLLQVTLQRTHRNTGLVFSLVTEIRLIEGQLGWNEMSSDEGKKWHSLPSSPHFHYAFRAAKKKNWSWITGWRKHVGRAGLSDPKGRISAPTVRMPCVLG